jgi:hypothetical protein
MWVVLVRRTTDRLECLPGEYSRWWINWRGGVTSETCGTSYDGGGATTQPLAEARGWALKRQWHDDVSSRSTSHSQPSGREKATKGAGHRPRKAKKSAGSASRSGAVDSAPGSAVAAAVHPSKLLTLEQLLAQQNYIPTFCPPPPYPGGVGYLNAGVVPAGANSTTEGGGTTVAGVECQAAANHSAGRHRRDRSSLPDAVERRGRRRRGSRSPERHDASRGRKRQSRSPAHEKSHSRSPKWRNSWRRYGGRGGFVAWRQAHTCGGLCDCNY